jgi:hypothetical protein
MPTTGHFVELYTSQILQHFVDFYTNPPPDRILVLHLELVGKARWYAKLLLSIPTNTTITTPLVIRAMSQWTNATRNPISGNNVSASPLTLPDAQDNASSEPETVSHHRTFSDFGKI